MILSNTRAKDLKGREERRRQHEDSLVRLSPRASPSLGHRHGWRRVPEAHSVLREAMSQEAVQSSREPGLAAKKAAEVLRKLPDCINEVAPPGHNQISPEDMASRRATAHTWPI